MAQCKEDQLLFKSKLELYMLAILYSFLALHIGAAILKQLAVGSN